MKISTKYSKLESRTITFNEADIQVALLNFIKKNTSLDPHVATSTEMNWSEAEPGDLYSGKLTIEIELKYEEKDNGVDSPG